MVNTSWWVLLDFLSIAFFILSLSLSLSSSWHFPLLAYPSTALHMCIQHRNDALKHYHVQSNKLSS